MNRADELYGVSLFSNDIMTIYGSADKENNEDEAWYIYLHQHKVLLPFDNYQQINEFVCTFREILVQY
jgi:hypothetical protein